MLGSFKGVQFLLLNIPAFFSYIAADHNNKVRKKKAKILPSKAYIIKLSIATSQKTFIFSVYSNLTIETLEKFMKYVQSQLKSN